MAPRRSLAFLAALSLRAVAYQDPNATAEFKTHSKTCVSAPCKSSGPCNPRFYAAPRGAGIRRGTAWVITVHKRKNGTNTVRKRKQRRATQSDWANMEHFAAAVLPEFEELYATGETVAAVVLPQIAAPSNFLTARGADTDWFRRVAVAAVETLNGRPHAFAPSSPLFHFRDSLGNPRGAKHACWERVLHATYVPRATYLKHPKPTAAFLKTVRAGAVRAPSAAGPPRVLTVLLRTAGKGSAMRAGPSWTNAREIVAELDVWLARNAPSWTLSVSALAHAFAFRAQADTAGASGIVLGAHGAALTNALFAPDGASLIEVLGCGHRSNTYRNLATNRGLAYFSATQSTGACARDLGRKFINFRRPLPLEEVVGPLSSAIARVEARAARPASLLPCAPAVAALVGRNASGVDALARALASPALSGVKAADRDRISECVVQAAANALSAAVAVGEADAQHGPRRRLLLAVFAYDAAHKTSLAASRSVGAFVAAAANSLIEAQRSARHVLFLHISKAAGTSFCKLAAKNKCAAPPKFSTMWDPGDGPSWGNCARGLRGRCAARELDCRARLGAFKKKGYELMAVERWMDGGGRVCDGLGKEAIWYATVLRDPVARVVSHHNHIWAKTLRTAPRPVRGRTRSGRGPGEYFRGVFDGDGCVDPRELPHAVGAAHRTGYDWSMVCALSSDYAARSLLGTAYSPRPYDASVAPILPFRGLLKAAEERLADFAVVLVAERAAEAATVLRHALGWRPWSADEVLPTIGRDSKKVRKVVSSTNVTGSDRTLLEAHNALDIAVYAYAKRLHAADVFFYDAAAEAGLFREPIADPRRLFCGFEKGAAPADEDDDAAQGAEYDD